MFPIRNRGRAALLLASAMLVAGSPGCAHRREAYYAREPGPGVHVRAPFVDVQVRGKPKSGRVESAARDRDEDDDDKDRRHARLPVDRED